MFFTHPSGSMFLSFGDEWVATRANVVGNYKIASKNEDDDHMIHIFDESALGHCALSKG